MRIKDELDILRKIAPSSPALLFDKELSALARRIKELGGDEAGAYSESLAFCVRQICQALPLSPLTLAADEFEPLKKGWFVNTRCRLITKEGFFGQPMLKAITWHDEKAGRVFSGGHARCPLGPIWDTVPINRQPFIPKLYVVPVVLEDDGSYKIKEPRAMNEIAERFGYNGYGAMSRAQQKHFLT